MSASETCPRPCSARTALRQRCRSGALSTSVPSRSKTRAVRSPIMQEGRPLCPSRSAVAPCRPQAAASMQRGRGMRPDVVELDRISDYPDYWAARRPAQEAMVLDGLRLTYADLAAAVDRCARAMFAAGVRRGDRVAVLCTPRPEGLICFLAAARLGAMFSGLNLRFKRDELAYVVGDSAPRLLIGLPRFEERDYRDDLRALAAEQPSIERVVTFFEVVPGLSQAYDEFLKDG